MTFWTSCRRSSVSMGVDSIFRRQMSRLYCSSDKSISGSCVSLRLLKIIPHFRKNAEAVRFELTIPCGMPPFQGGALDHYATPPLISFWKASPLLYLFICRSRNQVVGGARTYNTQGKGRHRLRDAAPGSMCDLEACA